MTQPCFLDNKCSFYDQAKENHSTSLHNTLDRVPLPRCDCDDCIAHHPGTVEAFPIAHPLAHRSSVSFVRTVVPSSRTTTRLFGADDAEDEEEDKPVNAYASNF
jgi:hypothetical protein